MTRLGCLLLCLLTVGLAACGDDGADLDHGLRTEQAPSAPRGEAVTVGYDLAHGEAYEAEISVHTTVFQKGTLEGRAKDQELALDATLRHAWTIDQPMADAPRTSRIALRYTQASGHKAEEVLRRAEITGRLAHDARGRAAPHSLKLRGGTKQDQVEMLDLVGSLLLAGYGGSPAWVPSRPVRVGEVWAVDGFLDLRATARLRQQARAQGVEQPEPRLSGSIRLRAIEPGADGPILELELDALLELEGALRRDGLTGTISAGNRYTGLAWVHARTGVPTRFDVTHTNSMRIRSGRDDLTVGGRTTARGTVRRTSTGK